MARYVEDLSLLFPILAGTDGFDPAIVPMPIGDPNKIDLRKLRTAFFVDNGDVPPTTETSAALNEAAKQIANLGLPVSEARPEPIEEAYDFYVGILWADGGAWAKRLLQKQEQPKLCWNNAYRSSKLFPSLTTLPCSRNGIYSKLAMEEF